MAYIQFYKDAACTQLWAAVPVVEVPYETLYGNSGTIEGYSYRDDGVLDGVDVFKTKPFLSYARMTDVQRYYCKNGLSIEFGMTAVQATFKDFKYGNTFLAFRDMSHMNDGSNHPRYWAIGFTDDHGKHYIGFTRVAAVDHFPDYIPISCAFEDRFWESAFRPAYDYGGQDDPDGGQGTGHYNHTGVSDSSTPLGIMPTGGRGLHYYKINGPAYRSLQGYLWGDASTIGKSLWQKFINRTHTPISCVIGCFALPGAFAPEGGGSDPIQIAGVRLSPIEGSCMSFDPGISTLDLTFPAQSGADKCFTDYSHTTCKLYVPYCGTIPIPMELALDRVIKVRYRVDQANGNLCACVWAGDCVVGELSGNCAYQIPVIGGDTGALDVLGATLTGLIQISSGDYRGALQSGAEALTAQHTTQIVNGDLSGAVSRCSLRRPYIEYTRNANTYTPGYFRTVGIPARISGTLSSFAGGYGEFDTQISSADIPGATGDEIAEITNLLREGVFV